MKTHFGMAPLMSFGSCLTGRTYSILNRGEHGPFLVFVSDGELAYCVCRRKSSMGDSNVESNLGSGRVISCLRMQSQIQR